MLLRLRGDMAEGRGFSEVLVTPGAQLVVAGLTGEYVWRILEEVRPPFVVARRVNAPPREPKSAALEVTSD